MKFLGWFLLGLFAWSWGVQAQTRVPLAADQERISLIPVVEYYEEPEGTWSFADFQQQQEHLVFRRPEGQFQIGFKQSVYWLRVELHNNTEQPQDWWLQVGNELTSEVALQVKGPEGASELQHAGLLHEYEFPVVTYRVPLFSLHLAPQERQTLIMRVEPGFSFHLPLSLQTLEAFSTFQLKVRERKYLFYGAFLVLVLFSLIMFFWFKETSYLFFSFLLSSFWLFWARVDLGHLFFEQVDAFIKYSWVLHVMTYLHGWVFLQKYLGTREKFRWGWYAINSMVLFNLGMVFLILIIPNSTFWIATAIRYLGATQAIVAISITFRIHLNGDPIARYYLYSLIPILVAVLIQSLEHLRLISNPYWGWTGITGVLLHGCLLLLAIGARFRILRRERELARQDAIENLRKADEIKNQILANTSHELRTPLHGIIGLSESLQKEVARKCDPDAGEQLQVIIENAQRLAILINDLLDVSSLQKGSLSLEPVATQLKPLLNMTFRLLDPTVSSRVVFQDEVPDSFPLLWADSNRLQQILLNLIGNASKYAGEPGLVRVSASEESGWAVIQVHDNGSGISEEAREQIFTPFYREANHDSVSGFGLGLSICKLLAEAHGGSIAALPPSEAGGTTFELRLPLFSGEEPLQVATPVDFARSQVSSNPVSLSLSEKTDGKSGTILVVDDDPVNLSVVRRLLAEEDYSLFPSTSGKEALSQLEERVGTIDLVLLDVMMPGMDGYETCEMIRTQYSEDELPVLLLTALNRAEDISRGFDAGANDYLCKPIHSRELQVRVKAHLQKAKLFQEKQSQETSSWEEFCQAVVRLQNANVTYWEQSTGLTKLDLAQQSGLWGAYLDTSRGGWRTRSFDRYLSLSSFPDKPRWRKVVQTSFYVIKEGKLSGLEQDNLREQANAIVSQHSKLKGAPNLKLDLPAAQAGA